MRDDTERGSMFGSSIMIEVNIDGVKRVESVLFSSQLLNSNDSNGLYDYVSEVAKAAVRKCLESK